MEISLYMCASMVFFLILFILIDFSYIYKYIYMGGGINLFLFRKCLFCSVLMKTCILDWMNVLKSGAMMILLPSPSQITHYFCCWTIVPHHHFHNYKHHRLLLISFYPFKWIIFFSFDNICSLPIIYSYVLTLYQLPYVIIIFICGWPWSNHWGFIMSLCLLYFPLFLLSFHHFKI